MSETIVGTDAKFSDSKGDALERWAKHTFPAWLMNNQWNPAEFIAMLEDFSLDLNLLMGVTNHGCTPRVAEPWELIKLSLKWNPSVEIRWAFYSRIAALLADMPDVKRPGNNPEKVLYNLFNLCIHFPRAEMFYMVLYRIMYRNKLRGNHEKAPLRLLYLRALMVNQIDFEHARMWKSMVQDGVLAWIPGRPSFIERLGLDGAASLPCSVNIEQYLTTFVRILKMWLEKVGPESETATDAYFWSLLLERAARGGYSIRSLIYVEAQKQNLPHASLKILKGFANWEESCRNDRTQL